MLLRIRLQSRPVSLIPFWTAYIPWHCIALGGTLDFCEDATRRWLYVDGCLQSCLLVILSVGLTFLESLSLGLSKIGFQFSVRSITIDGMDTLGYQFGDSDKNVHVGFAFIFMSVGCLE